MSDETPENPAPDAGIPETVLEGDVLIDRVEQVDLQTEMQRSYLDYAMAVIVGRALPDVRDGLKPVHRRVLYAMFDGGYRPDRSFNKCARVVGEVMGQYHPHGDTAIYDALAADQVFSTLMGEDVESRRNFIQQNAKDVRFLDI